MVTSLKPIETRYKGYRFRSRLEARWAVFFDALGVRWEYEKEGYDLDEAGPYLPDFWLPNERLWVEIKGDEPSEQEQAKAHALAQQSKSFVLIFSGQIGVPEGEFSNGTVKFTGGSVGKDFPPVSGWFPARDNEGWVWCECSACRKVGIARIRKDARVIHRFCTCSASRYGAMSSRLRRAYEAARSARFEHGESGSRW